jgi:hypothetical protein
MLKFKACEMKQLVDAVRKIAQAAPLARALSRPQTAPLLGRYIQG